MLTASVSPEELIGKSQCLTTNLFETRFGYAANCQPKALKRDGPMSFILHIQHVVVDPKLRGLKAFGCK